MSGAARVLTFAAALIGAVLIAALSLRTPGSASPDFSTANAMAHVRQIAKEPHPMGSPANDRVRGYLLDQAGKLGMTVETQAFEVSNKAGARIPGSNVIATLQGREPGLAPIILMAHYDSVPGSPGAADDAAGVAAALEIARVLKEKGHRRNLVLLFTDGEEIGLIGAQRFFAQGRPAAAVVNLEARGGGGRAGLFETSNGAHDLVAAYARNVHAPSGHSVAMLVYKLMPNSTDFTVAHKAGLSGFNFAFIGDPGLYHSPLATPERVSAASVGHMGGLALDAVRTLDSLETISADTGDPVFSDVFGLFLIVHAPVWGWLPITVAALALAAAAVFAARQPAPYIKGAAMGFVLGLGFLIVTGAALFGLNLISMGGGYYDRLAATGWLEIQAVLLCLAAALVIPRGVTGLWGGWIGLLTLGLCIAVGVQILAPQGGPLVAWPLMAATLLAAALAISDAPFAHGRTAPLAAVAGAVIAAFVLGWAHQLFVGAGQDLPSAMAPFALLTVMVLWPLLARLPSRRGAAAAAAVFLVTAIAIALKVRLAAPVEMAL